MLADILKSITPEMLADAIKSNPVVVQLALHKFEAYQSLGAALNNEQQVYISNNINKLGAFFKTTEGKDAISILAEEFVKFVK